jgi:hypothetical protein
MDERTNRVEKHGPHFCGYQLAHQTDARFRSLR